MAAGCQAVDPSMKGLYLCQLHPAAKMLFTFAACVHNMASVGDSKVAQKAGKKSSKLSQSGKLILAGGSCECPFPSPLTLSEPLL